MYVRAYITYLYRLTRDRSRSGSHDSEVVHQTWTEMLSLYIHGCHLMLCHRFIQYMQEISADGFSSTSLPTPIMAISFFDLAILACNKSQNQFSKKLYKHTTQLKIIMSSYRNIKIDISDFLISLILVLRFYRKIY